LLHYLLTFILIFLSVVTHDYFSYLFTNIISIIVFVTVDLSTFGIYHGII